MLVAILGRIGERRPGGGVDFGVGGARRRPGERPTRHAVAVARHQQLRTGADQRHARIRCARRGQVDEVAVGGRVIVGQPAQDDPGVQRAIGGQP